MYAKVGIQYKFILAKHLFRRDPIMVKQFNVGDKAPDFSLRDAEERIRTLKEFLGQTVALVFFIEAFSAACTKEVCEFRDSMFRLMNLKAQVVGIDTKPASTMKLFAEKNRISFPILIDSNREVQDMYKIKGPTILILNREGVVQYRQTFSDATVDPNYAEIEEILRHIASEDQIPKPTRNVVTVSKQVGSRGTEFALRLSEALGFTYLDKNTLFSYAKEIGVGEGEITDFSEDSYKIDSLLNRILGRRRLVTSAYKAKENESISKVVDEEKNIEMVTTVIYSLAAKGRIVIVGRGGQAILKNKTNVLHVRIVAPLDFRVEYLMMDRGVTRDEALRTIEDSDRAQSEFLQRFYGIDGNDPVNYHIVLNTANINIEMAVKAIAFAVSPNRKLLSKIGVK